jgi:hypothetical protein
MHYMLAHDKWEDTPRYLRWFGYQPERRRVWKFLDKELFDAYWEYRG